MQTEPEIAGVSIVVVGAFNPAIFTPAWFGLYGLLTKSEVAEAKLEIAHSGITVFRTDWLNVNVTTDRFSAETLQSPPVRVRDLVVRVFDEHLPHTPMTAFGINRSVHFQVENMEERDRIGRTLAPVEPWGHWSEDLGLDGEHGLMTSLKMSQIAFTERPSGDQITVTVEPSTRLREGVLGIFVGVNDHYTIGETDGRQSSRVLMGSLCGSFEASLERSEKIINHVMSLAKD